MSEFIPDKNPMPHIEIFNPLRPVLKALGWVCTRHQLSTRSDHFNGPDPHPFDAELYDNEQGVLFTANLSGFGYEPE